MSFLHRVVAARKELARGDWIGEAEERIRAPLPTTRQNVYEGDIGMDQNTAERIAVALEQIALELATSSQNGYQQPHAVQPVTSATPQPIAAAGSFPGFAQVAPTLVPAQCPIHGTAWRTGQGGGYYCPRKVEDGTWCKQKPTVAPQYARTAMP